jgi:hypothetical protein
MIRGVLIAVGLGFALAACRAGSGAQSELDKCELSALSTYKDGWQTWGPDSRGYANYIRGYMKVAGYESTVRPHKCTIGFFMEHNAYCYSPTGDVSYLIWRIHIVLDGGIITPSVY